MDQMEQTIEALTRRVEKMEVENRFLRAASTRAADGAEKSVNRRRLLTGGVGALGVLTGGTLLTQRPTVHAASPESAAHGEVYHTDGATSTRLVSPKIVSLQATLAPERGAGHHSALYTWKLGSHFTTARPPVVTVSAHDDYHGTDAAAAPSCAVAVHGSPGAYEAVIRVNNVGHWATEVTLQAIAIGE